MLSAVVTVMVRRLVRVGALFAAFAISVASCSDDEEPVRDDASTSGAGGESGDTGGGTGGRGQGGAQSGGTGGDPSTTGGSSAQRGGEGGVAGSAAESGGGAGGRGTPIDCSSALLDPSGHGPCSTPGESCSFGEQCCCGECQPEQICRCQAGTWECEAIDLCIDPMCGGAGGMSGAGT
jgi:hypothetical protein